LQLNFLKAIAMLFEGLLVALPPFLVMLLSFLRYLEISSGCAAIPSLVESNNKYLKGLVMALTPPPLAIIRVCSCYLAILHGHIAAIHFLFSPMFLSLTMLTSWNLLVTLLLYIDCTQ